MNVIYKLYLNNLYNFFVPQLKLVEKVRVGSKIVKKYDQPKTPYQRLLESPHLTMGQKEELRRKYQLLNPIELREIINRQILKLNRYKQEIEDCCCIKYEAMKIIIIPIWTSIKLFFGSGLKESVKSRSNSEIRAMIIYNLK